MKKSFTLVCAFVVNVCTLFAQHTLVINTDNTNSWDTEIASAVAVNNNYGSEQRHYVYAWTQSSVPTNIRTLLKIDLSGLPANAVITSAALTLFADPGTSPAVTGDNAFWLERVTAHWDEHVVTWNNQPPTDVAGRSDAPVFTTAENEYNIDVTSVINAIKNSGNNYGIMMKLKTETPYRNIGFSSTENANAARRPRLVINYILPSTVVGEAGETTACTLYPNPARNEIAISVPDGLAAGVVVYDALGRIVMEIPAYTGNSSINIEALIPGLYRAVITSGNFSDTLPFFKN